MGLSNFFLSLLVGEQRFPESPSSADGGIGVSEAIAAHLAWKDDIKGVLEGNARANRFAHQAGDDGACALGKWISGPGYKRYGHLASFAEVRTHHSRFHRLARDVMELHDSGQTMRAQELARGEFEKASADIVHELRRFWGTPGSAPISLAGR